MLPCIIEALAGMRGREDDTGYVSLTYKRNEMFCTHLAMNWPVLLLSFAALTFASRVNRGVTWFPLVSRRSVVAAQIEQCYQCPVCFVCCSPHPISAQATILSMQDSLSHHRVCLLPAAAIRKHLLTAPRLEFEPSAQQRVLSTLGTIPRTDRWPQSKQQDFMTHIFETRPQQIVITRIHDVHELPCRS